MKLIVWLGNPWAQYTNTRHNIGFLFVEHLREVWGCSDFADTKHTALISTGSYAWEKILLVQPLTYMNRSGQAVGSIAQYYKVDPQDVYMVYDDVDMEFGKIRFRTTGSSGGHNGVKSIVQHMGTQDVPRLKIGVGRHAHMDTADWVLSKFSPEEKKQLLDICIEARDVLEDVLHR